MELPSAHSPLGASGSYHWLVCPGSVQQSKGHVDPESDHAALGTAAHALAADCLRNRTDAWEQVGSLYEGLKVDKDMADAVQTYLDFARDKFGWDEIAGRIKTVATFIEEPFHVPELHEFMYGTADLAVFNAADRHLSIVDYKHGIGVVVEVKDNPQLKYYAVGMLAYLQLTKHVDTITTYVVQPRGFHHDGPIRSFTYSLTELVKWLAMELIPGMDRTLVLHDTKAGEHCRFCPARFAACPALMENLKELERMVKIMEEKGGAAELTSEELGHMLSVFEIAKIQNKAARETALARLTKIDGKVPGWKLVNGRTNRVWKDGAERWAVHTFGSQAYEPKKLKSPAQMEKLPGGDKIVSRWSAKPPAGKTIAPINDVRREISSKTKSLFVDRTKKVE